MATVIKLKSSSTPGAIPAPSSLQIGEVALNLVDGKIFVKDTLNVVKTVASGTIEGLADVDFSTAPTNNQLLSFDSATSKWVPITSGSAIGSTDDLAEGSTNLYYTTARTNTDFDTRLATKSTDNVSEGSTNLYYTDARADGRISAAILTDIGNVNVPGSTTAGNMMVVNGTGDGYTWIPQKKVLDDLNNVNAGSPSDGQFLQWDNSTNKWIPGTETPETVTSISYTAGTTTLSYTDEDGTVTNMDLSGLLDEDSRSIASGTLNPTTGIVTFTRDDASTFTMDLSALLDDTNLVTSVAGKTGAVTLDTSNVTEHSSRLYYTNGRFDSRFNTKTTDDLTEGSTNLYYTNARVDTQFATKTTDDLAEGTTNLYYTNARVDARIPTNVSTFTNDANYLTSVALLTDIGNVNAPGSLTAGNQLVVNGAGDGYTWVAQKKVLDDLNNVNAGSPSDGQFLKWDNTAGNWVPETVSLTVALLTDIGNVNAPGSLTAGNMMVVNGTGDGYTWVAQKKVLDDLNDINAGSPSDGQALVYDSGTSKWIPGTATGYTDAQADARIAAANIADLNDVTGTTTDGDILTYNSATSSYEFQAGFSLTVPSESSEAITGEILQWDFANNEFVIKDMYDLATSQRISREETATQIIYRFN